MNPYLAFTFGVFVGVFIGVIIVSLLTMAKSENEAKS